MEKILLKLQITQQSLRMIQSSNEIANNSINFTRRRRTQMLFCFKIHSLNFQSSLALLLRTDIDQQKFIVRILGKLAFINFVPDHVRQFLFLQFPVRAILTFRSGVRNSSRRSASHNFRCNLLLKCCFEAELEQLQVIFDNKYVIEENIRPILFIFVMIWQVKYYQYSSPQCSIQLQILCCPILQKAYNIFITSSMPPKKQEKKEIVRAFEPKKFWVYTAYPQDAVDKAGTFLTTFEKQLSELISQEKSLQQNFQTLCDKIGIAIHPCLQNLQKQESKFPELKNKDYGARLTQILNYKIDAITLKVLSYLLNYYKVNTIKFSRNDLSHQAEHLKKLIQKQSSASTLFLQWNPLIEIPNRRDIFISTVRPCVQHLILRENCLGNQICVDLITKIKQTPQMVLKSLDLTGNQLTVEIAPTLCKFIQEQKNIEFLGLSKNKLFGNEFLSKLFASIGQVPLTEQDYEKYLESVKARDEVVERNKKKKKGAADEPVPFVFELKQTQKGKFYVKNTSLQNLNLAKNGITDSSLLLIKNFAQNQGSKIQMFLDSNKFTKKSKDILQIYQNLLL